MGADATVTSVLRILNDRTDPNYQNANNLVTTYFCPDSPAGNPVIPSVGLTNYGPLFVGQNDVIGLFAQIFRSFPNDFRFAPVTWSPRLYSSSGDEIAIQVWMSGTQEQPWFPNGNPHFSPPISNIAPAGNKQMNLPACAVLTFGANSQIANLAIYFDRYRMNEQLR